MSNLDTYIFQNSQKKAQAYLETKNTIMK